MGVLGVGAAGAVVCKELSDDPSNFVICIDIGRDQSDILSAEPGFWGKLPPTELPWLRYLRSEELALAGRDLPTPISQVLGGGSSSNGNLHMRPSRKDFANFGSPIWDYDAILDDMKALETSLDDLDGTQRGFDGPIKISSPPPNNLLSGIQAQMMTTFNQPLNTNPSNGDPYGVGNWDRNVAYEDAPESAKRALDDDITSDVPLSDDMLATLQQISDAMEANGSASPSAGSARKRQATQIPTRQDSWTKILKPYIDRPNLILIDNANVINIELGRHGRHSVTYVKDGSTHTIKFKKELVLSMGVLQTPRLLMHSGIGNCDDLEAVGIECLVSVPELGYNFQDSILTSQLYATPFPAVGEDGSIVGVLYPTPGSVNATGGPLVNMQSAVGVFPDAIPNPYAPGTFFSAVLVQMAELVHSARGYVKVQSSNVFDADSIRFGFFENPLDIFPLVYHFKKAREMMNAIELYPGSGIPLYVEVSPGYTRLPLTATDTEIAVYLTSVINGEIHGVGTASIGKVVDDRLRLIDENGLVVDGIRIIDNSIIPAHLDTHSTSNTALIIGKVGSRFIKEEYGLL